MWNYDKNRSKKRYYSGHSDSESNKAKQCKQRGPSDDLSVSVSEVLSEANSVLFDDNPNVCSGECSVDSDKSVFVSEDDGGVKAGKIADVGGQPKNKDLMDFMKNMRKSMSERLDVMEKKLGALDTLE